MIIEIPDETTVLEAARLAQCGHLHLVTNGRQTVLSPVVMPGWYRLGVRLKPGPAAENQCTEAAA
jgi:hypothetical protein